ncbi:MAG TPA: type III pantothenate kinase [Burkholderiaceae bacterium]|nr:type III pantothenate kinase [Burkholderiaceae bacterium]
MTASLTDRPCTVLIDIGNTRLKIGWLDTVTGQRESAAMALDPQRADALIPWFAQENVYPVHAVGVNVAGAGKAMLVEQLFKRRFNVTIQWQTSRDVTGRVRNRYRDPGQLGADRWAAMIGLSAIRPAAATPMLLANFGTATTLDTLCPVSLDATPEAGDPDNAAVDWIYPGGLIFPGPELMRASLARNTAQLPQADGSPALFPTDTHTAIVTGIAAAQAGAVLRQWQAGLQRYGIAPRVFSTGGGWPAVQQEVQAQLARAQRQYGLAEQPVEYLPAPILDGLALMAAGQ